MSTRMMPTALAGGAARRTAAPADGGRAGTATLCVCVYIYMYVYIHVCMYIYIYLHILYICM